jgi:hypothetical protein
MSQAKEVRGLDGWWRGQPGGAKAAIMGVAIVGLLALACSPTPPTAPPPAAPTAVAQAPEPTPTMTASALPPQPTSTSTPTPTPAPPTASPTTTPVPPLSQTPHSSLTATYTPTSTSLPPTRVPTSTPEQPTRIPTPTPAPPTSAPQPSPTQETLYPAPALLEPQNGTSHSGAVTFRWEPVGELREDEIYDVRAWREDVELGVGRTSEPWLTVPRPTYGSGVYRWRVAVIRIVGDDPNRDWEIVSHLHDPWIFFWGEEPGQEGEEPPSP